jgi:hypothetical protein
MPHQKQFLGQWISWVNDVRIEQELFDDGRFEGVFFDEDGSVLGSAKGTWEVKGETIQWRYTSAENISLPKGVDTDKVTHVTEAFFSLQARSGRRTDWHRMVESGETSTNFDLEQVQPFLIQIAALVDSGFGPPEIDGLMKKAKKLKPDQSCCFTFPVVFDGIASPLRIRVFMDDVDAPDIYFYASRKLAGQIDDEIKKLDTRSGD